MSTLISLTYSFRFNETKAEVVKNKDSGYDLLILTLTKSEVGVLGVKLSVSTGIAHLCRFVSTFQKIHCR